MFCEKITWFQWRSIPRCCATAGYQCVWCRRHRVEDILDAEMGFLHYHMLTTCNGTSLNTLADLSSHPIPVCIWAASHSSVAHSLGRLTSQPCCLGNKADRSNNALPVFLFKVLKPAFLCGSFCKRGEVIWCLTSPDCPTPSELSPSDQRAPSTVMIMQQDWADFPFCNNPLISNDGI